MITKNPQKMHQLKFSESYVVRSYEVDTRMDALFTSICNYIQDIAGRHAETLGFGFEDMVSRNQFWVLSRLRVSMEEYPRWKEEVHIETWPSGVDRLFANREFRIYTDKGKLIGKGTTAWLIVSLTSRRPQNPDWVNQHLKEYSTPVSVKSPEKIPVVEMNGDPFTCRVKYSDLDQNNHLNNVKYLQLILDSYPDDFCAQNRIMTCEIDFLAESSLGDEVGIKKVCIDQVNNVWYHTMYKTNNDREICRCRITWEQHSD